MSRHGYRLGRMSVLFLLLLAEPLSAQVVEVIPQLGSRDPAWVLTSTPGGRYMLSWSPWAVQLWDADTGMEVRAFSAGIGQATSMSISRDGRYAVAAAQNQKSVWLCDMEAGPRVYVLSGHTDEVTSVAISPDGSYAVSGSRDKTMRLWEVSTGKEVRVFQRPSMVMSVAFSPDGTRILSGEFGSGMRIWDVATGEELRVLSPGSRMGGVVFTPDGRYVLTAALGLWDISTGQQVRAFKLPQTAYLKAAAVSADGKYVLAKTFTPGFVSIDAVHVWDFDSGALVGSHSGKDESIYDAIFTPDSTSVAYTSRTGGIQYWDFLGDTLTRTIAMKRGSMGPGEIGVSLDGRYALTSLGNGMALWDLATGREIRTFQTQNQVGTVAFSPDSTLAVSADQADYSIRLWDVPAGSELRLFKGHTAIVKSLAFSPDGRQVLSGSVDKTARLWDRTTGKLTRSFLPASYVHSAAFSPDGKLVLTAGGGPGMVLWDVATGKRIANLRADSQWYPFSVAFSPDGTLALSGGADNSSRLWDLATATVIKELRSSSAGSVMGAAISRDGRTVIANNQTRVDVWDARSGETIRELSGFSSPVQSLAFMPDGKRVLIGLRDGVTGLWDIERGSQIARFIHFSDGEWVCLTDQGYFNGSAGAARHLVVRDTDGVSPMAGELLAKYLWAEGTAAILAGKALPASR